MVRPLNLRDKKFTGLRGHIAAFIEHPQFIQTITVLILFNAITLGLETDKGIMDQYGPFLKKLDDVFLMIFTIEIGLKLIIYRHHFFRQGWNVFDFIIIGFSLMPESGPLAVLRALRVLRILRLMSVVPSLRRVIGGLLEAIPGMASVVAVLTLVFYVSAVLCTKMFGMHPDPQMQELFGTLTASMYSLFQIMTLEGWSENIVRPTMDHYPWAWMFFIPFIIVTAFAVLNLFIGIIVDAMQQADRMASHDDIEDFRDTTRNDSLLMQKDLQILRAEIAEIKEILQAKK